MRASAATGAQAQDMATPSKWQRQYYKDLYVALHQKKMIINMRA